MRESERIIGRQHVLANISTQLNFAVREVNAPLLLVNARQVEATRDPL